MGAPVSALNVSFRAHSQISSAVRGGGPGGRQADTGSVWRAVEGQGFFGSKGASGSLPKAGSRVTPCELPAFTMPST